MSCRWQICCIVLAVVIPGGCSVMDRYSMRSNGGLPREAAVSSAKPEDIAQFRRAEELIGELKYPLAEEILTKLADKFRKAGDVPRASKSLFWMGFCAEKLFRSDQAIARYDKVIDLYPGTAAAEQSRRRKQDLVNTESE